MARTGRTGPGLGADDTAITDAREQGAEQAAETPEAEEEPESASGEEIYSDSTVSEHGDSDGGDLDDLLDAALQGWASDESETAAKPSHSEATVARAAAEGAQRQEAVEALEGALAEVEAAPPALGPHAAVAEAEGGVDEEVRAGPLPPVAAPVPAERAPRLAAEKVCSVPGGKITWYRQGYFTALCQNPHHGRCVLTRHVRKAVEVLKGDPLGC